MEIDRMYCVYFFFQHFAISLYTYFFIPLRNHTSTSDGTGSENITLLKKGTAQRVVQFQRTVHHVAPQVTVHRQE